LSSTDDAEITSEGHSPAANGGAVEMRGITKRFATLLANDSIDLSVAVGEVHALLGENGAGKTTLMRILYGLTSHDAGTIRIGGVERRIRSPRDAIQAGIGMVTQHFSLVDPMKVSENLALGDGGFIFDERASRTRVSKAAEQLGARMDPNARVDTLSVGEQQRVEILKALARNCRVLILDEPTAVLAPQEVHSFFDTLRRLKADGLSIIFITHKLSEVMAISDRITVLRRGRNAGTVARSETDERKLATMMVGQLPAPPRFEAADGHGETVLELDRVTAVDVRGLSVLKEITIEVRSREILGVAGVSGNGQTELAEVLSGMRSATSGTIAVAGFDVSKASPRDMIDAGVGRVPEDRRASVIGDLSVAYNLAIEHLAHFTRNARVDERAIRDHAEVLIQRFDIRASPGDVTRTLSGGNLQKVLLARVLSRDPRVIVAAQPTRGLDVGSTEFVRGQLRAARDAGAAVVLISEDLDEILALADRVVVMYEGRISDPMLRAEADAELLGLLMAGRSSS
jgi:general nucleoside transport system ATP-binding protein